ncbi:MAG TPA: adenylosuccinate lyase family protein [Acidimicrobiia bacterium]|nr:adenylosuccinate lyase family protein [Acidimicrobiia bacterium]
MRGSAVYAHLWTTPEVEALLGDEGRLASWLDILAALARAQGELGLIPAEAADEIARRAVLENLDMTYVVEQTRATEHSTLGLIRGVQQVVSAEAGEWFCYGATVQDVADTWCALVMRDVGRLVERELAAIEAGLRKLARRHRATAMAARTHGQPGLPVTFGYKAAVLAAELRRHRERLGDGATRWLVGQLGGAAGTGSLWGPARRPLVERFCDLLGLGCPEGPWISARDRLAEFGSVLAMVCATLGKLGNEVLELQRPEIGELSEPFTPGAVGSITMPHKRNPERSEHLVTLARLARAESSVLVESMIVEHERDGRSWKAEWAAFPDVCRLTSASLRFARDLVDGLVVDAAAMAANVESGGGYLFSERVMAALAARLGKQTAHRLVYEASMAGVEAGRSFREALEAVSAITDTLSKDELDELLDPAASVGQAPDIVDEILASLGDRERAGGSGAAAL